MSTPEIIYLIPGEYDGEQGTVWCDCAAPDQYCDPDDAVKYVRADIHESALKRQGSAAKMGMDAAKKDASWREENAKRLLAKSNPAALESERAANAELTAENERLQERIEALECMIKVFRGCIDTQIMPGQGSPCHKMVWELVGAPDNDGDKQ